MRSRPSAAYGPKPCSARIASRTIGGGRAGVLPRGEVERSRIHAPGETRERDRPIAAAHAVFGAPAECGDRRRRGKGAAVAARELEQPNDHPARRRPGAVRGEEHLHRVLEEARRAQHASSPRARPLASAGTDSKLRRSVERSRSSEKTRRAARGKLGARDPAAARLDLAVMRPEDDLPRGKARRTACPKRRRRRRRQVVPAVRPHDRVEGEAGRERGERKGRARSVET